MESCFEDLNPKHVTKEIFLSVLYCGKKQPIIDPPRGELCVYYCQICRTPFFIREEMDSCLRHCLEVRG